MKLRVQQAVAYTLAVICLVTLAVFLQVNDQLTGLLEVRASSDEAAAAGQKTIEDFLNDPEVGTIYRSVPSSLANSNLCHASKLRRAWSDLFSLPHKHIHVFMSESGLL